MARVGWIGLGRIGTPMAGRLAASGHALTVWARRPEATQTLAAAGAQVAASVDELAGCEVLCTCVGGPDDVRELQARLMPMAAPGTLFIDCSTADPATAVHADEQARARGLLSVDAPVTGGVAGAARGTLTAFVGGRPEACDRARPVLAAFASRQVAAGGPGSGYRLKLVNQTLMVGSLLAVAQAARLAHAAGFEAGPTQDALAGGTGASTLFEVYWKRMMGEPGPVTFTLGLLLKDLRLARAEAHELGCPTQLLDAALDAVDEAIARHGPAAGLQALGVA